jgi:hypothetical protein
MILRLTMLMLLAAAQFIVPSTLLARQVTLTRQEIRQKPILERPSRPGHFYGNTVRRGHVRTQQSPQS